MITTSLNKDKILQHITMQDICLKFLDLSEQPRSNISSPFSDDKKPSFKLYANGTFKCNSSGKQGDCWQLVADLNGLNCKTQMAIVLSIVATEMNLLHIFQNVAKTQSATVQKKDAELQTAVEAKQLSITTRNFTALDIAYWNKLGISEEILKRYGCKSISSYCWTGKSAIYTKNVAVSFAWELNGNHKLYIPEQSEAGVNKFCSMPFKSGIFGLQQLGTEKKESIIIVEGEKDVIVAVSRGLNAVTFGSGSIHSKKDNIVLLFSKCNTLFVCFDADPTGIIGMQNLIDVYPEIIPIYLPKNLNIKGFDITDYFQINTLQNFYSLMQKAFKNK